MASNAIEGTTQGGGRTEPGGATTRLIEQVRGQAGRLAEQGLAKIADLAEDRKEDAVAKIESVAEVVRGLATAAEAEFGEAVGGAVGRGATGIERVAERLRGQSVGDMVDATRSVIFRHPALAIGAASLTGFLAGRIAKAGFYRGEDKRLSQGPRGEMEVAA